MLAERLLVATIVVIEFLLGVQCEKQESSSLLQLRQLVASQSKTSPPPRIRPLSTVTVTSGNYVLNVFSDSSCTSYVSQQTFLLNVCYTSSTSGQYNIGVLQIDSTSFSSFTVKSSTSSASCTSLVTSGTNTPSSSYTGESCTALSTGFYYKSTWSAFPSIVPPTSTSSSAYPDGYIIKEYDDDGSCALTLPRTTTFLASSTSCIPYRSVLNSVATIYYVTGSCSGTALTLLKYTDSSCATLLSTRNIVSAGGCQSSTSFTSSGSLYALYMCATYTYASTGYVSTQYYSDSTCSTTVGISEMNMGTQCFSSAYTTAGYVSNVVQYYARYEETPLNL